MFYFSSYLGSIYLLVMGCYLFMSSPVIHLCDRLCNNSSLPHVMWGCMLTIEYDCIALIRSPVLNEQPLGCSYYAFYHGLSSCQLKWCICDFLISHHWSNYPNRMPYENQRWLDRSWVWCTLPTLFSCMWVLLLAKKWSILFLVFLLLRKL